jgi:hypothetical protein
MEQSINQQSKKAKMSQMTSSGRQSLSATNGTRPTISCIINQGDKARECSEKSKKEFKKSKQVDVRLYLGKSVKRRTLL